MKNKTVIIAILALTVMTLSAQNQAEGESFRLTKQGGRYVFSANINNRAEATILLESGIPALLIDSAFAFNNGVFADMELPVADEGEQLNLGGRVYRITHKANGTVPIGNSTSFVGEVFVLSNYDYGNWDAAVPVMYLHNDLDHGSRIVNLDLGNQSFQMLGNAAFAAKEADYAESPMNTDTYMNMPAVETSLMLDDGIRERELSGNYLIDLGNPELLFLLQQNEDVQRFLADNADMELREARTPNGVTVGRFVITEQSRLCGVTFSNAMIAITGNLPRFTTQGDIGLRFFEHVDAVFDFDRSVVFMKGRE